MAQPRARRGRRRSHRRPRPLDDAALAAERAALEEIYRRSNGPIAFVDESFRVAGPGNTFYVLSAALFERDELALRRTSLANVTGDEILHATEWFHDRRHEQLTKALVWAEENVSWHYIAVKAPVPTTQPVGAARGDCLRALLRLLDQSKANAVVLDTRGRDDLDSQDQKLAQELRRSRDIAQHTVLHHVDDRAESLLGCADLVAWSYRRLIANDDTRWWPHVAAVTTVVDAERQ